MTPQDIDSIKVRIKDVGKSIGHLGRVFIPPQPVAHLIHEATGFRIEVIKPIQKFQRFFIRLCFGLKYEEI